MAMSGNTLPSPALQSLDASFLDTNEAGVSKPKGFLDLPGELRNWIYDDCLSDVGLSTAIGFGNACRTTRSEYMPLYFGSVTAHIHFVLVERFFRIFYADTSAFPRIPACKLVVELGQDYGWGTYTSVDLKWLGEYLRGHPDAEIFVEKWEMMPFSLYKAIDYIPSICDMYLRLNDREAVILRAQPVSVHTPSGVRTHALDWVLTLVMKPKTARRISGRNSDRIDQAGGILTLLHLRGGIDGKKISSLEIQVGGGGEDWHVKFPI